MVGLSGVGGPGIGALAATSQHCSDAPAIVKERAAPPSSPGRSSSRPSVPTGDISRVSWTKLHHAALPALRECFTGILGSKGALPQPLSLRIDTHDPQTVLFAADASRRLGLSRYAGGFTPFPCFHPPGNRRWSRKTDTSGKPSSQHRPAQANESKGQGKRYSTCFCCRW